MVQAVIFSVLVILKVIVAADIYDVTSIYHVGHIYNNTEDSNTVEVHLRTNARGLAINFDGKAVDNFTIGRQFPALSYEQETTSSGLWEIEDGAFEYQPSDLSAVKNLGSLHTLSKIQPIGSSLFVQLSRYFHHNSYLDVVILPYATTTLRQLPDFYMIRFNGPYRKETCTLLYCTINTGEVEIDFNDFDGQRTSRLCVELKEFKIDHYWTFSDATAVNNFLLDFSNKKVQIWTDIERSNKVLDWEPYPAIQAKYISLYYSGIDDLTANFQVPKVSGLKLNGLKPLVSPWFTTDMDHLCVVVVLKGFGTVDLNITVENSTQDSVLLGNINDFISQESWKVLHFTSQMPDKFRGSKIRMLLTSNTNDSFTIQRISSCNAEGDVALISLNETRAAGILQETAFEVYSNSRNTDVNWCSKYPVESNVTVTSNGGCEKDSDVVCPSGFSGWNCETACGRNRFGMDCSGVCSKYTHECQGLRLCTPAMGCHCAPGYSGETCDEKCESGKYGNDCNQDCGHCEDNILSRTICDIYTGHCTACQPGYYPPYCKATYPVVTDTPEVSTSVHGQASVIPKLKYKGRGVPIMYQIQYRESKAVEKDWKIGISDNYPQSDNDEIPMNVTASVIEDLNYGEFYDVRVILITDSLDTYNRSDVPFKTFSTLCTIPDGEGYDITKESNTNSITINWEYKKTNISWCPVIYYEIARLEDWKLVKENSTSTSFTLSDLNSGEEIKFKIRAYTSQGFSPYSETVTVSTKRQDPGPVRTLFPLRRNSSTVLITWNRPENIGNETIDYHIKYQCLVRFACASTCDPRHADALEVQVSNTSATLYSLMPFTQYLVTISAGKGQQTSFKVATKMSVPTEVVEPSTLPPVRTNNSVTVMWNPVQVCSGFLQGYIYQFYKEDDKTNKLKEGFTRKPFVTLEHLSAHTGYVAHIFIKTFAGWNPHKYLQINISTSATVPEQVRNLTVYKQGRNLIGLNWAKPNNINGVLKSFTVMYGYDNNTKTETVPPKRCAAWPHLFCHTLYNLNSNKRYTVSVSARNTEVFEEGTPSSLSAVTKEGLPGLPENLHVVNTTSTSLSVSWNYPYIANGIIRSFLMSVEETEQYETDKCCEIYPLVETVVKEELLNYTVEVSGLNPASTYTVSVSTKTISIGPSVTLTIYTRPPSMPLQHLPIVISPTIQQEWIWLPQHLLENINNTDIYIPLIKGRILLVVMNSSSPSFNSGIEDEQLDAALKKLIQTDYYFAVEYNEDDLIAIGTGESVQTSWGKRSNRNLEVGHVYSLAAVQISDYCGVYNIDIVFSSTFTAAANKFNDLI